MPRAGVKMDSKEMAEEAHKHMFQLSGFSHIWALLHEWFKVGQVRINTFPREISIFGLFYDVVSCLVLYTVDCMNISLGLPSSFDSGNTQLSRNID
jgi:hypothetical protein